MRDRIIIIFWTDPLTIEDATHSENSLEPGLYYITHIDDRHETS